MFVSNVGKAKVKKDKCYLEKRKKLPHVCCSKGKKNNNIFLKAKNKNKNTGL